MCLYPEPFLPFSPSHLPFSPPFLTPHSPLFLINLFSSSPSLSPSLPPSLSLSHLSSRPLSLPLPPVLPSTVPPSLLSLSLLQQVQLESSLISASPDNPEAALDAIMQVALCEVSCSSEKHWHLYTCTYALQFFQEHVLLVWYCLRCYHIVLQCC